MNAEQYIKHLNLQPHPEGGYYIQNYRSNEYLTSTALPERFTGNRPFSTAIFYLLKQGDFSSFHRIKSDEVWHFYSGSTLYIHVIKNDGSYYQVRLGNLIEQGETFQFVVPAGEWFAVEPGPQTAFALTGCTVAPGFDFNDFEMGNKKTLLSLFSQNSIIINRLCRY
jgi:predicted cupin superfamily sugar epimerase